MFATIERELGGLDVLVNNAGIATGPGDDREAIGRKAEARIMEMLSGQGVQTHLDITQNLSDEAWQRVIGVHLHGTFHCTREALRLMSRRNRGAIVNMSSVAALMGLESVPHYSAAKGAILSFTRAVARDVASRGIRVNAICPGYIDTPMTEPMPPLIRAAVLSRTPLGRTGDPREIAATALFLVSDDSSFFTGQWLSPNGGLFIG
jgi:3-oxoacyl-[acyl-carrier protein] reductase